MAGDGDARAAAIRERTQAEITHPGRVLYPSAGLTRLDVIGCCLGLAPTRYSAGRPGGRAVDEGEAGVPPRPETGRHSLVLHIR